MNWDIVSSCHSSSRFNLGDTEARSVGVCNESNVRLPIAKHARVHIGGSEGRGSLSSEIGNPTPR